MSKIVFLDTGIIGLVTHPKGSDEANNCVRWLLSLLRKAAEMWASSRQNGVITADPKELDGDVILCAQALLSAEPGSDLVVATTNVGHLANFVQANTWNNI